MLDVILNFIELELASFVEEIIITSLLGGSYFGVKIFKEITKNKLNNSILGKVFEELNDELTDTILSKLDDKEKKEVASKPLHLKHIKNKGEHNENDKE